MSKLKNILFISVLSAIVITVFSCSKEESINIDEYLFDKLWVIESYIIDEEEGFKKHHFQGEFTFFKEGIYAKTKRQFTPVEGDLPNRFRVDTVEIIGEFNYDNLNKIIDFEINDTITNYSFYGFDDFIPIGTEDDPFDWEILNMTKNEILVKSIIRSNNPSLADINLRHKLILK